MTGALYAYADPPYVDAFPVHDGWDGREQLTDFVRHCTEWETK